MRHTAVTPRAPAVAIVAAVLALGAWGSAGVLWAQDLDDLFAQPDETLQTQDGQGTDSGQESRADEQAQPEEDGVVDIGALTTSPTSVSGSVSASAGISLGLNEWPGSDAAAGRAARDLIEPVAGYTMSMGLSVDSRPKPNLRFSASLSSGLSPSSLRFGAPSVGSAFVDYTAGDALFMRAGVFGMGWGRARIFSSPGNLVSRVGSGAGLRASVPMAGRGPGTGSATLVAYSLPAWVSTWGSGDPRSFGGAALVERTLGSLTAEVSGHYQFDEGATSAATLTVALGSITLAAEGRYAVDAAATTAIGNFFWESSQRAWSFWGEYSWDEARRDANAGSDGVLRDGEHLVGLAMRAPGLFRGAWRPQLTWRHAVGDGSGQLIAGSSGSVAPDLSLSVGVPVYYGRPGSYYRGIAETRVIDEDGVEIADGELTEQEQDVLRISGQNVISLGLGLSISFSF